MANIGFIGLGHMGLPMAMNLLQAGHIVTGYDLNPEALKELVAAGGRAAGQLLDIAQNNEFIFTMLQSGAQVEQVCLGDNGLYAHAHHLMHIDCSSIDVPTARRLHHFAAEKRLLALDAPVSGGVIGAQNASLTFMVGGRDYDLEKARPILEQLGKKIIHAGAAGSGQAAKICNNMILGATMAAVCESFSLAQGLGLSPEKLLEVVNSSSGQCWVTHYYAPLPDLMPNVPANQDYQPGFTVNMMLKDLLLGQTSATEVGIHTPVSERATFLYQQFKDAGYGHLDFSAIIKMIEPQEVIHES